MTENAPADVSDAQAPGEPQPEPTPEPGPEPQPEPARPEPPTPDRSDAAPPKEQAPEPTDTVDTSEPTDGEPVVEGNPKVCKARSSISEDTAHKEACKAIEKGPYESKVPGKDQASALEVFVNHSGYKLTFAANQVGYFKYSAFRGCDHFVYFDQDLPIEVEEAGMTNVAIKSTIKQISQCMGVKLRITVTLPKAQVYYFKVGPFAKETVVTMTMDDGHGHE